jgi:hypothetical protein
MHAIMRSEDAKMSNRTRQPKRIFRARSRRPAPPVDHAARFEAAMRLTEVEDFLTGEQECSLCGAATTWLATRITTFTNGRTRLEALHLCERCQADNGLERLDRILGEEG